MDKSIFIPCASCAAINRVKVEKLSGGPMCARCKARIEVRKPVSLNAEQFDKVVMESNLPVLVDFWAPWCGPCRSMRPLLESLAQNNLGKVVVAKLNTDENPELSARFGIRGIPTLILFSSGREVSRQVGAVPLSALEAMINNAGP